MEFPRCAGILRNWLQGLEKKVNKVFKLSSSTKEAQIKRVRHMQEVNKSITFTNEEIERMEVDRKEKSRQILKLENNVEILY